MHDRGGVCPVTAARHDDSDPALVAPFLSAMIDTADDSASMIDELIVMLQKKREKLAAKKQT